MSPQNHPTRQAIYSKLQAQNEPPELPESTVYPRYMYHQGAKNVKPRIVHSAEQEAALGEAWGHLPFPEQNVVEVNNELLTQPGAKPGSADPGATAGVSQVLAPPPGQSQVSGNNARIESGNLAVPAPLTRPRRS